MKFAFIDQHRHELPVRRLCQVLEVSASGYYAAGKREESQRARENRRLLIHSRLVHRASRETYGYRRIVHERRAQGVVCGRHRVARLMRQAGLRVKARHPYKVTTHSHPRLSVADNVLDRDFSATQLNQKWMADITYLATDQGWLYLATVMDLFSRKIVGWSMNPRLETELVSDALKMALFQRCPQAGLLHHSDRGSQYASHDYQALLAQHGIQVSMSRTGNCYDNAVMESFFATLKTECVDWCYATRDEARACLFDYIEVWYNLRHRHSALGYLSPLEFEHQHTCDKITLHYMRVSSTLLHTITLSALNTSISLHPSGKGSKSKLKTQGLAFL
ncbi:MAG: IS3 family transposase [Anaerolineae bacterium]|nr:IS3 family transposase [Anaerolineae bacterium]